MAQKVLALVGTKKGAFIFESNAAREKWTLRGPMCENWPLNHMIGDPKTGTIYAAGGNAWFGPAVWKSTDQGATWTHSSQGIKYLEGQEGVKSAWSLAIHRDRLYVGVEPAGLFYSDDQGETFHHVEGLTDSPTREHWNPGGAGLILHTIVPHPTDPKQVWVGVSAAGVFHTGDGGTTWEPRNKGTRQDYAPDDQRYPEFGQCVHHFEMAPGMPNRLYQQNHCGMYRSDNGGKEWVSIEAGLPSTFGFPASVHPRDPDRLFLFPLNGDSKGRFAPDAKAAVWSTCDCGKTWQAKRNGLPQQDAYIAALRQAMATDTLEPAGVYFGTSSGGLFASNDEAENWKEISPNLPPILSVETLVLNA